jgi:mannosyl-3-phosphoglycerate phosphatase
MASDHKIIIYSDLDGTFLDHQSYSYDDSFPALQVLTQKGIPVIFCSSKTLAELETLWDDLPGKAPFITENGAAIFIQGDFFKFPVHESRIHSKFKVIELGTNYPKLLEVFRSLKADFPGKLKGFCDMTVDELAADSGLTAENARKAKKRGYSEVFKIVGSDNDLEKGIVNKVEHYGLKCSKGGRYYHLHGDNDKGSAVKALNRLFKKAHGRIRSFGIGDSLNDLPMLESVDVPVLVKKNTGYHEKKIIEYLPHVRLADGIGPRGWALAAGEIMAEL